MGFNAQHRGMVMLEIAAVPVLTDNYVWLIHNDDTGETAAVDPSVSDPVLAAAAKRGWSLTQVLNTHWHPDHTGGNEGIKAATGCTITAPAEAERVSHVDHVVAEGDRSRSLGPRPLSGKSPRIRQGTLLIISETKE